MAHKHVRRYYRRLWWQYQHYHAAGLQQVLCVCVIKDRNESGGDKTAYRGEGLVRKLDHENST